MYSDSLLLGYRMMTDTNADNKSKKRPAAVAFDDNSKMANPFLPMFDSFRTELDTHYDRRERIVKASRDITAASKKM